MPDDVTGHLLNVIVASLIYDLKAASWAAGPGRRGVELERREYAFAFGSRLHTRRGAGAGAARRGAACPSLRVAVATRTRKTYIAGFSQSKTEKKGGEAAG